MTTTSSTTNNNRQHIIFDNRKIKTLNDAAKNEINQSIDTLTYLSLNGTSLLSLEGFPAIPNLTKLELNDNKLSDSSPGIDSIPTLFPNLKTLRIGGNYLKSLELFIKNITPLTKLECLEITLNRFGAYPRELLFANFPALKVLDGCDATGQEVDEFDEYDDDEEEEEEEEDEEEGGLKAFYDKNFDEEGADDEEDDDYSPPETAAAAAGCGNDDDAMMDDDGDDDDDCSSDSSSDKN